DRISDLRIEFLKDAAGTTDPKLRQYLLGTGYRFANILLKEEALHPVVHANAVLILGQLNKIEAAGTNQPPVPHPALTKRLVEIVQDPKLGVVPKSVAIVELVRHAQLRGAAQGTDRLSPQEVEGLTALGLELLQREKPTASQSAAAHEWIRTRAAELLGALRSPGKNQEVAKVLLLLVGDPSIGLDLRIQALRALALLDRTTLEIDSDPLEFAVGRLVADACGFEVRTLMDRMRRIDGGNPGPTRQEVPGFDDNQGPETIKDLRTTDTRRRLLPRLKGIQQSLTGNPRIALVGLVEVASPGAFEDTLKALKNAIEILSKADSTLDEVGSALREQQSTLDDQYPKRRERGRRRGAEENVNGAAPEKPEPPEEPAAPVTP
ncbi:MAG TPA: hypothetical protein VIY86_13340, partial [Pirellulaceae bacterium]